MPEAPTRLSRVLKYLKSLWGVLAALTSVFPLASKLLKIPMVSDSVLSAHYAITASLLSLITILVVVTFRTSFKAEAPTRKAVAVFGVAAILCWFGFIGFKTSLIYDHMEKQATMTQTGTQETMVAHSRNGEIKTEEIIEETSRNRVTKDSIRVSPYEIVALALFTFSFVLLTATFAALGMYYYNQAEGSESIGLKIRPSPVA